MQCRATPAIDVPGQSPVRQLSRGEVDGRGSNAEESPDSKKTRCRVTPGRGNPTDSATENKPPALVVGKGETVG